MGGEEHILFQATLLGVQVAREAVQTHQGTRTLSKDTEKVL